jgi:hypothetical protein
MASLSVVNPTVIWRMTAVQLENEVCCFLVQVVFWTLWSLGFQGNIVFLYIITRALGMVTKEDC